MNQAGVYHMDGLAAAVNTYFSCWTGASVSLLRADTWERITSDQALLQWSGSQLVGVEGM